MAWTNHAARIIATTAYQMLRSTSEDPPASFLDQCTGDALITLELENSENTWGSQGDPFLGEDEEETQPQPMEEPELTQPRSHAHEEDYDDIQEEDTRATQDQAQTEDKGMEINSGEEMYQYSTRIEEERVDIPEGFTDQEQTPHQSPRHHTLANSPQYHLPVLSPPTRDESPVRQNPDGTYPWPTRAESPLSPSNPLPTFSPLRVIPSPIPLARHRQIIIQKEEQEGWNVEAGEEAEDESSESMLFVLQYFHKHPDLAAHYTNSEATGRQCPACNRTLGGTVFDVYTHALNFRGNHILIHRAVAEALRRLYNGEEPPRSSHQFPREQARPNRRPAPTRR